MKLIPICLIVTALGCGSSRQDLITGKRIEPRALSTQKVGNLPFNMIATPDGQYVVATDQGTRQWLHVIRISDGVEVDKLGFQTSKADPTNGLYYGLAAAPDGTIYAAQGGAGKIAVLRIGADGKLSAERQIVAAKGDSPSGLAVDGRGILFACNNDPVGPLAFDTPGSVVSYGPGGPLGRFEFSDSFGGTPNFPLAVAAVQDGSRVFVGSQRDNAVYALDATDPAKMALAKKISTGAHPVALLLDRDEARLFVANAGSDTVSVADTRTGVVTGTVLLRPDVARGVSGATPTGLALSPDEKTLYVTLGDMNCVAVVDVASLSLTGCIPAGWYPSAVAVSADGAKLVIANAKGSVAFHPNPPEGLHTTQSPLRLVEGSVITVAVPNADDLREQSKDVLEYNRLVPKYVNAENPLQGLSLASGKIKHIIYIVKENRTYDQVLGDVHEGNGNPAYCIFGKDITPNQHALAKRFVLLDNFYDCGEVSGDGWVWSTQAMANEYVIRNVPYSYSDRGRMFDYEGSNNGYPTGGFPATGPDGKPLSEAPAFKNGARAVPDVAEAPGGHIWDAARRAGLTYRNYGFYMTNTIKAKGKLIIPDNYPASAGLQPGGHDLAGLTDIDFRKFDLDYPDSDASTAWAGRTGDEAGLWNKRTYGKYNSTSRFAEWKREFDMMLAKDPAGAAVPNLMMVRFCTDHTAGVTTARHSPRSMVADNDYAVGQLVEAVSRSAIWQSTAVFIIEDDAQNGPDHVDAHRSTCLVVSPYITRASIDHTFHNTASCLKTIESLLNLPPMCQYDAVAGPIMDFGAAPLNAEPYEAILPAEKIAQEQNPKPKAPGTKPSSPEDVAMAKMIAESEAMDFSQADKAPAEALSAIIWKSVRGVMSQMPASPNALSQFGPPSRGDDEDDDDDD